MFVSFQNKKGRCDVRRPLFFEIFVLASYMLFKRTNRIIFDLKAVAVAAAIPLKNVYKV